MIWHTRHFPRLTSATCFPRLSSASCFPALVTGYIMFPVLPTGFMFSRACHRLHVTRACHWLHFSRACHRLFVLPCLPLATCFSALVVGCMFPALVKITSFSLFLFFSFSFDYDSWLCYCISVIFRLYHCGRVAGKIFCILAVIDLFILWLLEWLFPRKVCLK